MIDEQNFLDQPVKNDTRTYENIRKISTDQGDDYRTGYLQDYPHCKGHYKITSIDLSKQQALYANLKAIQETNFTGNVDRNGNTTVFFY